MSHVMVSVCAELPLGSRGPDISSPFLPSLQPEPTGRNFTAAMRKQSQQAVAWVSGNSYQLHVINPVQNKPGQNRFGTLRAFPLLLILNPSSLTGVSVVRGVASAAAAAAVGSEARAERRALT